MKKLFTEQQRNMITLRTYIYRKSKGDTETTITTQRDSDIYKDNNKIYRFIVCYTAFTGSLSLHCLYRFIVRYTAYTGSSFIILPF